MDGWWVISVVVGIFIYFASHRNVTTASSFVRSFIFPLTFLGSFIFIFAYRVFELCLQRYFVRFAGTATATATASDCCVFASLLIVRCLFGRDCRYFVVV